MGPTSYSFHARRKPTSLPARAMRPAFAVRYRFSSVVPPHLLPGLTAPPSNLKSYLLPGPGFVSDTIRYAVAADGPAPPATRDATPASSRTYLKFTPSAAPISFSLKTGRYFIEA